MRHSVVSRLAALTAVATLGLGLAACANSPGTGTTASQQRVAFLRNLPEGAFSVAELDGLSSVLQSEGYSIDQFAANYDPGAQLTQCDTAITSGDYAGIVIIPVDIVAATPCVTKAKEAGIPVVSLEQPIGPDLLATEIQTDGVSGQVVINQPAYVQQWAQIVVEACANKNPCNLGLVRGDPAYPDDAIQRKTWDEQVAAHPQLTIVAESVGGFSDPNAGITATQTILQTAPDVAVIAASDDETAAGIVSELQRSGRTDVAVVGFGGVTSAIDRIKAGTQYGSVVLTPKTAATAAGTMLVQAIRKETIPAPSVNWTQISPLGDGNVKVTKANADLFTPEY